MFNEDIDWKLNTELIRPDGKKVLGTYMFTLDWSWENKGVSDLNFSETPEHKCVTTVQDGER